MWMIFVIAGIVLLIFYNFNQQRSGRNEDRRERLKEMRQQEIDMLLEKKKEADDDSGNKEAQT